MNQAMFCQSPGGMSAHSTKDTNKGLVILHFSLKFLRIEFLHPTRF